MIIANLVTAFRQDMRDRTAPYLWSDEELIRYINDARLELCKKAWGISDIIELTFTTNDPMQALPRWVTKVKTAAVNGKSIAIKAYTEVTDPLTTTQSSTIECLLTGVKEGYLRSYPRPSAPVTVQLLTLCTPKLQILSITDDDVQYELPQDSVLGVLHWMRAAAYQKEDSETFDRGKADEQLQAFYRFADGYKHMHERREHQPGNVKTPTGDYW